MQSENPFRSHQLDVTQQIIVIGVIGEGKRRVYLVSINRVWIDRPATDHGHAFTWNFLKHARAIRARRTNQNFAAEIIRMITKVMAKFLAVLFEKIPRKRVAMISGWAVDPNA